MFRDFFPRPVFAPSDGGAPPATPLATPPSDPPATPPAAPPPSDPPASQGNWWEKDIFTNDDREYLTARGLTVDDPLEALPKIVQAHRNAEKRLGQPADQILSRPAEGQELGDWMRENGELFQVPEAPDKYDLKRPDLKDGVQWNEGLETKAREVAHSHGVSNAALQAMTEVYAAEVQGLLDGAETDLQAANEEMMGALQKDWGDQTNARIAVAKQAAQAIAEQAGMDKDAMQNLAMSMKPKTGDAGIIRLFAAIGEMMGEDMLSGGGGGGGQFGTTPAEARQRLAQINGEGGEMAQAYAEGNQAKIAQLQPEIERLSKIASQK